MPNTEFDGKPGDATQPDPDIERAYQLDADDTMVVVRVPKRVLPKLNRYIARAGAILAEDDNHDGVLTYGYSPSVLRAQIRYNRTGAIADAVLVVLGSAAVVMAALNKWEFLAGVCLVSSGLQAASLVRSAVLWRKQRALLRKGQRAGLLP